jgi:hypothetical protein
MQKIGKETCKPLIDCTNPTGSVADPKCRYASFQMARNNPGNEQTPKGSVSASTRQHVTTIRTR